MSSCQAVLDTHSGQALCSTPSSTLQSRGACGPFWRPDAGPCSRQVLSKADTERFVAAAHLLLAPGGVFFGSTGGAEDAGARCCRCAISVKPCCVHFLLTRLHASHAC